MRFRLKYVLPALLTALTIPAVMSATPQTRTICKFPTDRSLGTLQFADPIQPYTNPTSSAGEARGDVPVPPGHLLILKMKEVTPANLEALKGCGAGLTLLLLNHSDFADSDVHYLLPLKKLTALHLDGTNISDKGIAQLAQLPALEFLSVNETEVTGSAFRSLKELRYLDAIRSDATDAALESLRGKDLRWLRLSRTKVSDKTIATISGARNLFRLHIDWTRITPASMPTIARFKKLEDLHLGKLPVGDDSVVLLKDLPLYEFVLAGTKVTDAVFADPKGFKSLKDLRLEDTKITDKALQYLSTRTRLQSLDLSNTRVTDKGVAWLNKLIHLQTLSLVGTDVTDASLKALAPLQLRDLAVSKTKVTKQGVEDYLRHHRQCRISHDFMFD